MSIFIILTPLQLYLAEILIKELNKERVFFIVNIKLKDQTKKYLEKDILYIEEPDFQDSYKKKIKLLIKLYKQIKKINLTCEDLFIANDNNIYVQLLMKKINYKNLFFYEEGGTLFYKIAYKNKKIKKYFLKFLKSILRVENTTNILTSKDIKKAYVFFSEELRKYNSKIKYVNLEKILIKYIPKIEEPQNKIDYILLTQPLTEDKLVKNNLEVEIIKKIILKDKKYLIKIHPREKEEKYSELLKLPNVKFLSSKYKNVPYQTLHYELNPKGIITFFSSILYTIPQINNDFERVALVKELKNEKIIQSVEIMSKYIKIKIR